MWRKMAKFDDTDVKKGSANITPEDMQKVIDKEEEIKNRVRKGPLAQFFDDVKTMISMVKDYSSGKYKVVPWWVIAAVVFALLYVFSPVDVIPDVIPGIGLVDDALVVSGCLALIHEELAKYRSWKATTGEN